MASTSNQIDSSYYVPSSSSFTPRWNVFLSFRGKDTRGNFTGHLYKALDREGIQTFMDDPELPRGEKISPALLKAIQESKISIVVISKNYASSTWCLDELMKILECRKTMGQLVLPVFYKVDPSEVRYQRGSFAEAFEKHKNRFVGDLDKVKKWRATLTETADLSGYHLDANGNEPDLIEQIVKRVNDEVNPIYLNVAKKPVGIASHVKNITPLLSIGTNGVRKIGIYGMGGVGKTTVAKAVYNENFRSFQGNCFLANVREVSGQLNGIVRLQEQFLSEVLKSKKFTFTNVDNGISFIKEKIQKRVLIVLDDLDHRNQLDSLAGQWNRFASGSIIMITTRDARLLDQIQVDGRYKVEELNNNDSLELFSLHAFGKTIPPSDGFMELSREIIGYAGGLPLALEVFGSNLFNQDELEWTSFIKKLRENPNSEIEGKLKISFDALENVDRKDIFLDIACFFIGWNKDQATTILSACYSCAENDIGILIKRCLLKFNNQNELTMHDLLRDLGRKIAHNKFSREPQKHSRLWRCVDICNVLKKNKGTKSIEGIVPYDGKLDQVTLNTKTFERMQRLRLLYISDVHLTGSFEHIFEELRWLCWSNCSLECLPSDFRPKKLVILELDFSNIKMLCKYGNLCLEQLKILNLTGCRFLKTTSGISGLASLEKLLLGHCERLVEVHPSIGRLGKLVCLDLSYCTKLTTLTSRVCNLRALKYLYVNGCSNLKGLPEELGNMKSISVLNADKSSINKLPDSIGLLRNLHELNLNKCKNLISLPSSIGQLRGLKHLIVDGCSNLESLPEELGKMKCLTKLFARSLSIKNLPDSIGQLSKLAMLDLGDCGNLRFLPDNICNLRALECLILDGCSNLESLPEELWKMECLTKLHGDSINLKKIPDSIGDMKNLRELHLSGRLVMKLDLVLHSPFTRFVPPSITGLCSLNSLNLKSCNLFDGDIPDNIGSLSSLETLNLSDNFFRSLPFSLIQLSNLRWFRLERCKRLRSLQGIPPNLYALYASECTSLKRLPNLSNLKGLVRLELNNCSRLVEIQGLENLKSLTHVGIDGCDNLESTFREIYRDVKDNGCWIM